MAHLVPAFGRTPIATLTRADVERLHQALGKETPGQANRVLQLVSSICGRAEDWGYRPQQSNPAYRIRKFRERRVERFLSAVERSRLEESLEVAAKAKPGEKAYVARGAITAVRLLSLTGCRCGEIVTLEWRMVDLERGFLRLPDSKTGEKVVPMSEDAVAFLRALPKSKGLVCPNDAGGSLANLERSWRSIRKRAGLGDVRLHDLRHSFASDALAAGVDIKTIGTILGHKSVATTERYAHLAPGMVRDGVNAAGRKVAQRIEDGQREREEERKRGE